MIQTEEKLDQDITKETKKQIQLKKDSEKYKKKLEKIEEDISLAQSAYGQLSKSRKNLEDSAIEKSKQTEDIKQTIQAKVLEIQGLDMKKEEVKQKFLAIFALRDSLKEQKKDLVLKKNLVDDELRK